MKRILSVLLAVAMIASCFLFVSCAKEEEKADDFVHSIKGLYAFADVTEIFPTAISKAIVDGMETFDHTILGFAKENPLFCGVESRTSAPVRILRDEFYQANVRGIYPCGEGAGYAGGITSAAMDGIRVAEAIAQFLVEVEAYKKGGFKVMKVIHGYGSHGVGGEIRNAFLKKCQNEYRPKRVMIEFNGTWSMSKFIERGMPKDWELVQVFTLVDASTFESYMNNMRQMMNEQISFTELVIFNRCNKETKRNTFRKAIKAMNRRAQIVFESEDGEEGYDDEIDLPYDMEAEIIEIDDDDYGIFYLDSIDQPQKYAGKTVQFTAMVYKGKELPKGYFVPGRFAMTCCADDIAFVGLLCKGKQVDSFKMRDWVKVTAQIQCEYHKEYNGEGPVLYLQNMEHTKKPKEHLVYMN